MWFWWYMYACNLLIPVIMAVGGRIMWKHCPKNINFIFGYRTSLSMKNMDTWKFAHEHCGRLWWKTGLIVLLPSTLVQIPFFHSSEDIIGIVGLIVCTLQLIVLIISIIPTEAALKKTFFDDGTRR